MGAAKQFKIIIPIKAKIILVLLTLSLLLIFIHGYIDYTYSKTNIKERILSDLQALTDSKAAHIRTLIEEDFEDLHDVAGRVMMRTAYGKILAGSPDVEKLKQDMVSSLVAAMEAMPSIKRSDILTLDGKVIASIEPEDAGKDFSKTTCFARGFNSDYLSDPYMSETGFEYEMGAPVFSLNKEKKEKIGVARVIIDTARLYNIISDYVGLGNTGETVLGKYSAGAVIFLGPLRHMKNPQQELRIPLKSEMAGPMKLALQKKTGITVSIDYRGKEVLAAYTYIPLSGWGIVVKIDKDEAFKPIDDLLIKIIAVGSILFLLAALSIINIASFISGPVKRLTEGTKEISGGNLDYRINIKTRDEIGLLGASFNDMAASLKQITVSHDRLNEEIEERRKVEKELQRAMEAKSKFTSMVSHELRTPLAAIKEGISIVIDGVVGKISDEQKGFLSIAKMNVDRLTRLINDILDFQKLEAGKMELKIKANDMVGVLDEIYRTMRPLTEEKGIGFTVKAEGHLPKILFDRDKILQVLTNLVSNAVKFTQKGGVEIIACVDKAHLLVRVCDSGIGIKQDDMPRLFRSFEQLEEAVEKRGGTGLGLAISKEIIDRHHGRIWARSEYGKGTTVFFALPIK
jgi:signal transduction histidine kinase